MKRKSTPTIRSSFALLLVAAALAGSAAARGGSDGSHVVVGGADSKSPPPDLAARGLPPIVFVVRNATESAQIPGLGPDGHDRHAGGWMMVRDRDGTLRNLILEGAPSDVSDPAVSWDGRRIAFSGIADDGMWRIFVVGADGTGLRQVTRSDRAIDLGTLGAAAERLFARYDDFDPCWLPDGRIVFASTRFPQLSQEGRLPVSNLFVVSADGAGLQRLTSERNGAEEPAIDPTGRIVYARWFFNPYLATDTEGPGWTTDRARAAPGDTVDHWQLVSIFPDGDRIEFAAGSFARGHRAGASQPCFRRDGSLVAVAPTEPSMFPAPGHTALVSFGAVRGEEPKTLVPSTGYAASPAAMPDGRIVYAWAAANSKGNPDRFALYVLGNKKGDDRTVVAKVPGKDVLDPVALVKRKVPPIIGPQGGIDDPAWTLPVTRLDQVRRGDDTFRFDCLNVYLTGPVDSPFPDAPKIAKGARIRFFAALARPEAATGDTVVLVRDAKLETSGAVHESDIPGDVPLFEQLVDENGRLMRSAHGPAHVPGSNFSRIGSGTKCVGCHEGHSALPVPKNNYEAKWFNASTSAIPTVSSGTGASELVDRRAKGTTGWVAEGSEGQWARLEWPLAVEARSVVLYASENPRNTLHIRECQLVFFRDGREVGRASAKDVKPGGTRVDFPAVRLDAIEVRPTRVTGRAVALAEIETIARMIE